MRFRRLLGVYWEALDPGSTDEDDLWTMYMPPMVCVVMMDDYATNNAIKFSQNALIQLRERLQSTLGNPETSSSSDGRPIVFVSRFGC